MLGSCFFLFTSRTTRSRYFLYTLQPDFWTGFHSFEGFVVPLKVGSSIRCWDIENRWHLSGSRRLELWFKTVSLSNLSSSFWRRSKCMHRSVMGAKAVEPIQSIIRNIFQNIIVGYTTLFTQGSYQWSRDIDILFWSPWVMVTLIWILYRLHIAFRNAEDMIENYYFLCNESIYLTTESLEDFCSSNLVQRFEITNCLGNVLQRKWIGTT